MTMISSSQSVLLVEDDDNDVLLLQRAFRNAGVTAPMRVASDGEEAVEYLTGLLGDARTLRQEAPGLVILDLKLPRKSGLEVLAWMRQQPGLRRLPVVVLTSSDERRDVQDAYDLGANSYLLKPVIPQALTEAARIMGEYWLGLNVRPDLSFEAEYPA
jgi:CheY-like chemotaxis protein